MADYFIGINIIIPLFLIAFFTCFVVVFSLQIASVFILRKNTDRAWKRVWLVIPVEELLLLAGAISYFTFLYFQGKHPFDFSHEEPWIWLWMVILLFAVSLFALILYFVGKKGIANQFRRKGLAKIFVAFGVLFLNIPVIAPLQTLKLLALLFHKALNTLPG